MYHEAVFDLSAYGMQGFFERNDLEFDGKNVSSAVKSRHPARAGRSSTIHPLP